MNDNELRCGNFTSSEIFALLSLAKNKIDFGSPALTYINKKRMERKLRRSLETSSYSRAMAWGNFVEDYVFTNKIEYGYDILSKQTIKHPSILGWTGSPDLLNTDTVGEIKCYYPENFCSYADVLLSEDLDLFKKEHSKEYWQLISNAIINDKKYCEAILFMPNSTSLDEIKDIATKYEDFDTWKYRFIYEEPKINLPWLPEESEYNELVRFKFEAPEQDKELLTEKEKQSIQLL